MENYYHPINNTLSEIMDLSQTAINPLTRAEIRNRAIEGVIQLGAVLKSFRDEDSGAAFLDIPSVQSEKPLLARITSLITLLDPDADLGNGAAEMVNLTLERNVGGLIDWFVNAVLRGEMGSSEEKYQALRNVLNQWPTYNEFLSNIPNGGFVNSADEGESESDSDDFFLGRN